MAREGVICSDVNVVEGVCIFDAPHVLKCSICTMC
jgi:hypothetical protein